MAPKRSYREEPPSASSSSETETEEEAAPQQEEEEEEPQEEGDEEEEEDENEEEEEEPATSPPLSQKKSQPQLSDSETESEPDRDPINRAVKPNGKHASVKPDKKKPDKKKRRAEECMPDGEASKRVKTESNSEAEKKQFFQRKWSDSDEMEVMKGLIELSDMKDSPVNETNNLYELVKKKIQTSVTKRQLKGKVQNLKKRFRSYEKRVSKGAKLKPQEDAFLEMSRKIWGSSEKATVVSPIIERKEEFSGSCSHWFLKEMEGFCTTGTICEEFVRKGMNSVDERKRADLDKRWRRLQAKELEIVLERARLIQEEAALIVQAYKSFES